MIGSSISGGMIPPGFGKSIAKKSVKMSWIGRNGDRSAPDATMR